MYVRYVLLWCTISIFLSARHPSQIAMARVSANAFCPRRTHLTTGEPTIPRQPSHPITAAAAGDTTLATPAGTPHPPSRPCHPRPAGTIQTALREALAAFTLVTRVPPPTTLQANSIIILLQETTTILTIIIIIMIDQLQALPVTGIDGHQRLPYNAMNHWNVPFNQRGHELVFGEIGVEVTQSFKFRSILYIGATHWDPCSLMNDKLLVYSTGIKVDWVETSHLNLWVTQGLKRRVQALICKIGHNLKGSVIAVSRVSLNLQN